MGVLKEILSDGAPEPLHAHHGLMVRKRDLGRLVLPEGLVAEWSLRDYAYIVKDKARMLTEARKRAAHARWCKREGVQMKAIDAVAKLRALRRAEASVEAKATESRERKAGRSQGQPEGKKTTPEMVRQWFDHESRTRYDTPAPRWSKKDYVNAKRLLDYYGADDLRSLILWTFTHWDAYKRANKSLNGLPNPGLLQAWTSIESDWRLQEPPGFAWEKAKQERERAKRNEIEDRATLREYNPKSTFIETLLQNADVWYMTAMEKYHDGEPVLAGGGYLRIGYEWEHPALKHLWTRADSMRALRICKHVKDPELAKARQRLLEGAEYVNLPPLKQPEGLEVMKLDWDPMHLRAEENRKNAEPHDWLALAGLKY